MSTLRTRPVRSTYTNVSRTSYGSRRQAAPSVTKSYAYQVPAT